MANAYGAGGGRMGPYWRRKLGLTLPGERTQEQLSLINRLRAKAGQDPLGGPVGDNTRTALSGGPDRIAILRHALLGAGRQAFPAGHAPPDEGGGQVGIEPFPTDGHPGLEGGPAPPGVGMGYPLGGDVIGGHPWTAQDTADLRSKLLQRTLAASQPLPPGRDALRRYVQQAQMRHAAPAARRPVMPPRFPQRRAQARRPY